MTEEFKNKYKKEIKLDLKSFDSIKKSNQKPNDNNVEQNIQNIYQSVNSSEWESDITLNATSRTNSIKPQLEKNKQHWFKPIHMIFLCVIVISTIFYFNQNQPQRSNSSNIIDKTNIIETKKNEFNDFINYIIKKAKIELSIDFTEVLKNIPKIEFDKVSGVCRRAIENSNDDICFKLLKSLK